MRTKTPLVLLWVGLATTTSTWASSDPLVDVPFAGDPFDVLAQVAALECPPEADATLALGDVVNLALCANPATREAWANARYQAAAAGMTRSASLPQIDGTLGTTANRASGVNTKEQRAAIALSWVVFDFGARASTTESALQLLHSANATQESVLQAVRQSAIAAFFSVQAAQAALEAARRSEAASAESHKASLERYQVGVGTPSEELQAKTALSQATLLRIQAEGDVKTAEGALATLLGRPVNAALSIRNSQDEPVSTELQRDIGDLVALARTLRPDLVAAEARVKSAEASVDAARASGLPSIRLTASTGGSRLDGGAWHNTWQNNSGVGLTLSIPLFTGYYDSYRQHAAVADREAKVAARDRLKRQVDLDVWTAYQHFTTANQQLRTTADLLASAERSEQVTLGRYKGGVGSILDVLSAQSALASARQQRVSALHDWNVSRANLAFAIGNLDANLINRLASGDTRKEPRP